MKKIFLVSGLILLALGTFAYLTLPSTASEIPVLYWTTDRNPARVRQVVRFEEWMRREGYQPVDLKVDTNNSGVMKVIIQSASGVASDVVDSYGGHQLRQYEAAGILKDVTGLAKEYGFGFDKTYDSVRAEISVGGTQYAFPCNVTGRPLTINLAALEEAGLPKPKFDWTWEEFLTWAKAVTREREGRMKRYALMPFDVSFLWPTNGGTIFNETMTRCTLDSPRVEEATRWYYDLIFKHEVVPSQAEVSTITSESGYGGTGLQLVGHGDVIGVHIGRYGLIQLRHFDSFKPGVALLPHKLMPLQRVRARSAVVNVGGEYPDLAARFLEYLAGETYNRTIIEDADALPPNPAMAQLDAFRNPPEHPEEGPANVKYYRAAAEYGVGREYSPFVKPFAVQRIIKKTREGMDNQAVAIDDGLAEMTEKINTRLRRTVARDPKLKKQYEKALARQKKIDRLKKQGKPVPLKLIDNPVYRRLKEAGKYEEATR
jgi:multiple sugar transport system substrate-binding protein